jgi:hypothetical protein
MNTEATLPLYVHNIVPLYGTKVGGEGGSSIPRTNV